MDLGFRKRCLKRVNLMNIVNLGYLITHEMIHKLASVFGRRKCLFLASQRATRGKDPKKW